MHSSSQCSISCPSHARLAGILSFCCTLIGCFKARTFLFIYIHIYIHIYTHIYKPVYIHKDIHIHTHTYV